MPYGGATIRALILPLFFALLFTSGGFVPGTAESSDPAETQRADAGRKKEIAKILNTLEGRMPGKRILRKAESKLCEMPSSKLSLISMLCDRIMASDETAGADIAYSLVTAMIILE